MTAYLVQTLTWKLLISKKLKRTRFSSEDQRVVRDDPGVDILRGACSGYGCREAGCMKIGPDAGTVLIPAVFLSGPSYEL